ncbi:Dam family site-specific DNA-(adenine-N6)-methyltransferase [Xenorhabdus sp. XENO-10]|uniref:Site-specific DNA-methyltransferase (adenine-specific) n=1 Tax=Xenorhabdus yunnanensis TaxID=3025878 RepID=A0ABT5LLL1_9GAMM|nr:Dam family site-specific DNA-(adenine-N6)-methyltransferase [Xenorhabdus yunnanensis]MDC9590744.1 Dam family site-specific DNA-(adenine-N6)-methyltransferase [Xenorhabdus yunnanensis]
MKSKSVVNEYNRPFLKWAGGKYSVLEQIFHHLPCRERLIEPFVGGGSVFLNAGGFERYILADINNDLINLYQVAATSNDALIDKANCFFKQENNKEVFLDVRRKFNAMHYTPLERAAAFLYLNRHCFNGLIRYNRHGKYNVSFGNYKRPPYFPKEELKQFASIASRCEFTHAHYSDTIRRADAGDVIFCDPPYEPLPDTNGFTNYVGGGFTFQDQCSLANELVLAHQRGAHVVITNSSSLKIREMYESMKFKIYTLNSRRTMSCKGKTRGPISDLIAVL